MAIAAGGSSGGGGGVPPDLREAIRLLQLSRLELIEEIRRELEGLQAAGQDSNEAPPNER